MAERSHVREMYKKLDKVDDERSKTAKVLIEGVLLLSFDEGEDSVEALEVRSYLLLHSALVTYDHSLHIAEHQRLSSSFVPGCHASLFSFARRRPRDG